MEIDVGTQTTDGLQPLVTVKVINWITHQIK